MSFRESDVAITNATRWKLARIVAATQPPGRWGEKKTSVEALTETILSEWITAHHPELDSLWEVREGVNDRAHQAINERNQSK